MKSQIIFIHQPLTVSTSGEYIAGVGFFARGCEEGLREPQVGFLSLLALLHSLIYLFFNP